jgi:CRP-like cAMP-binding protein
MRGDTDLLRGLTAADASAIEALGHPVALSAGDVLFPLGGDAECLYLIRRGRIVLTLPIRIDGHDQDVAVEDHEPGETLGWSALVPPHKFTLKGSAPLPSEVLAIPRAALLDYCSAHPAAGHVIGMNIAVIIGRRLQIFQAMWLRQMQRAVSRAHA